MMDGSKIIVSVYVKFSENLLLIQYDDGSTLTLTADDADLFQITIPPKSSTIEVWKANLSYV